MKAKIPTNHNFYEEAALNEVQLQTLFCCNKSQTKQLIKTLFNGVTEYTTKQESLSKIKIFGFEGRNGFNTSFGDEEKPIVKFYSKWINGEQKFIIQTGLFAGVVFVNGVEINITSNYGDQFLKRMLNALNDIMVDNSQLSAKSTNEANEFEHIIAYLFVQSLEKSAVLGLPQRYKTLQQHSHKVRGKIDVNQYLKKSIPFTGKLTTSYREQRYEQIIVDVLYLTCKSLEKKLGKPFLNKVMAIYQLLGLHFSGHYPSINEIKSVSKHQSLHHSMYQSFKQTLAYASIILTEKGMVMSQEADRTEIKGYLFDIAQLFECYLEKIFNHYLPNWMVSSQEKVTVYNDTFFERNMYPDLILTHTETGKVMVFDAKFKRMRSQYRDLDRADFYQIHSYMSYYQQRLVMGGLLYPFDEAVSEKKCHSDHVMGQGSDSEVRFIVDGVHVGEGMSMQNIIDNEKLMIKRILA